MIDEFGELLFMAIRERKLNQLAAEIFLEIESRGHSAFANEGRSLLLLDDVSLCLGILALVLRSFHHENANKK